MEQNDDSEDSQEDRDKVVNLSDIDFPHKDMDKSLDVFKPQDFQEYLPHYKDI